MKTYCDKDEKGEIKNFPNGPFSFATPELEKQHDAEFLNLMETTFEVKIEKFPLESLSGSGLTGIEIQALTDVLILPD